METLVRQLNDLCDAQPFHTGWYLKDLRTGTTADRHGNVVVPSASTRKIAIMMTALQGVRTGDFALDQPVTIQAKYQNNNSGCFQHLQPGFTITFQDALVMMIIVSDNTCTGTVADMVGLDRINALCRSIGMVGTTHRHGMPPGGLARDHAVEATNATTPADVGLLLECILDGTRDEGAAARLGCTPVLCQLGLDILSWQKLNARMPMLMPPGTKIAHKTGTGARNYNDAGIVFQGEDPLFVLTVYTENVPDEMPDGLPGATAAQQTIAYLTRACWDTLKA
jgi:beta-lactamase class A